MASSKGKPEAKSTKRSPADRRTPPGRRVAAGKYAPPSERRVGAVQRGEWVSFDERVSRLLTGRNVKTERLIGCLREGLAVTSVERVMKGLGIESTESLLPIIGMSSRTYARRKQSNQALTPLESDRLYRLAKIESLAEGVLGDKESANDWLQSPNRALGAAPLALLDTEAGTEQVETILTRIEHGVYS
ncbi:MAG: antitoxin Xre/MbcA/ParS toxin-binding domain-containing protein [Candidatus Thiodiazotropha sp.]